MNDPYNLERFVKAQYPVYPWVGSELRRGRKTSHWMWFVFPQIRGLGRSSTAVFYSIGSIAEAQAYLEHPVLGPRLLECTAWVNQVEGSTIDEIFGFPDNLKFRSCMTLFAHIATDKEVFDTALAKYCDGKPDQATLKLLQP
ncbi:MAG: DUF1810 domain-containing protein [Fimbriimonas sp.]|nr:DUF1810 domain-containing protein [Fimbriimonas sp.]